MNYIHITKEFNDKIKDDPRRQLILRKLEILKNVERLETLKSIDKLYKDVYIIKFSKTNLCRIISQIVEVEIRSELISVLFIREFITKKSFDYNWGSTLHPQLKSGEWLKLNPLHEAEVELFKYEFEQNENDKNLLKVVPERLRDWMDTFKIHLKFDVFEREDWVIYSSSKTPGDGLQERDVDKFKRTIREILEPSSSINLERTLIRDNIFKIVNELDNVGVIISDFKNVDQKRIILLHNGANLTKQQEHWSIALEKAKTEFTKINPTLESISKDAFRAYPKWILNKEDYWSAIQKHNQIHNLSLLPEQVNFLNKFKFPSYINGQAGSGKSTMLYYLFAEVFSNKFSGEIDGDIIFLTENNTLLEHSIQSVTGLLANNPEFDFGFSVEDKSEVRKCFSSFKLFLLEILPEEEREKFPENYYLDFPKFKEKYNNRYNNKNKYSAEEVWFVISTYVYGYFENKKIDTIQKFNDIPGKFRIIEDSRFKDVLEESLSFYDNLLQSGWWDKISLIKSIRNFFPDKLPQQYSAVFCDEAQDFSRIELRLILKSCEYTNYDLTEASQIPIVFAGDALQTVSPIGFTVRRLQQMYFETFQASNFTYDKEKSTYTPTYNYRSLEPIVRIANIIQNYRKATLNEEYTLKQKAKRTGTTNQFPILHYKEWILKSTNKIFFDKKFKYKSFIVPVDLNEEQGFIESDELLSTAFPDIKSSIDAKGAEYGQVVVYGFGDEYVRLFGRLKWDIDEKNFKKKFFFNKLYVAITRAQNELIIIDSKEASEKFWRPLFMIPNTVSDKWEEYSDIDEVIIIHPETGLDNVEQSVPDDALKNAIVDMEQGLKDRNAARLMVASNIFLILGEKEKAHLSLGYKEFIKKNWSKSAKHFLRANDLEKASNSFFNGEKWNELLRFNSETGNKHEARKLLAKLMSDQGTLAKKELKRLYELRSILNEVLREVSWYKKLSSNLVKFSKGISSNEDKRDLVIIFEHLVKDHDFLMLDAIANLYFDSKQYSQAIENWDRIIFYTQSEVVYSENYLRAKIGNAIDENNSIEELLWSGRLFNSNHEISDGERNKIANFLYRLYVDQQDLYSIHDLEVELISHLLSAIVFLQERSLLSEVASILELKSKSLASILLIYEQLIRNSKGEEFAIFLKERWAKTKIRQLENKGIKGKHEILKKINSQFSEMEFPFSDSNQDWTLEELSEISAVPEMISSFPNNHFKNITIEDFRKFRYLEINNIGKYNLILGDNNSGKTSLLEALLFSPKPNECLTNLLFANMQRNNNAKSERFTQFFENILHNSRSEDLIKFTIKDGRRFWKYILKLNIDLEDDSKSFLSITANNDVESRSTYLNKFVDKLKDPDILKNIPFIAFGKGYSENIASIYHNAIGKVRILRNDFIKQLKIFIPDIVGIVVDTDQELIEIEELRNDIDVKNPLHNYGEGANKLFRILVQLHTSKNGRLNIDEIDAGIHFSKFKEFWKIILNTADNYNVQLFATTHNEECIRFFWEVLNEADSERFRKESRVITLEKHSKTNEIIPIVREYENLKYSYNHNLEIRGRV